jgi:hypothetical protein
MADRFPLGARESGRTVGRVLWIGYAKTCGRWLRQPHTLARLVRLGSDKLSMTTGEYRPALGQHAPPEAGKPTGRRGVRGPAVAEAMADKEKLPNEPNFIQAGMENCPEQSQ